MKKFWQYTRSQLIVLIMLASILGLTGGVSLFTQALPVLDASSLDIVTQVPGQQCQIESIDFNADANDGSLAAGNLIEYQWISRGIQVSASNPDNHPLMIFDSDNPTGNWQQLNVSGQGNILMLSLDRNESEPSITGTGGSIYFSYVIPVDIESIQIIDIDPDEIGGSIEIWRSDSTSAPAAIIQLAPEGNSSVQTVQINESDVQKVVVNFVGSGAVDTLEFTSVNGIVGDCNNSCSISMLDIDFIAKKFISVTHGSDVAANFACDPNQDAQITAGDLSCIYELMNNRPCLTENNPTVGEFTLGAGIIQPDTVTVDIPIYWNPSNGNIDSILFTLSYDSTIFTDSVKKVDDSDNRCNVLTESPSGELSLYILSETDETDLDTFADQLKVGASQLKLCNLRFTLKSSTTFSETVIAPLRDSEGRSLVNCGTNTGSDAPCTLSSSTIRYLPHNLYLPVVVKSP